jgi:hypothetical protein
MLTNPHRLTAMLLANFLATTSALADVDSGGGRQAWERGLQRQCPSHHVEWLCDACKMALVSDYFPSVPPIVEDKITSTADVNRRCANDQAAFPCPARLWLDAINKLGRMRELVVFSCRHYTCESPSVCKRT